MGVLIGFLSSFIKWFFTSIVIKFFIFGLVYISVTEIIPILLEVFLTDDLFQVSSSISGEISFFLAPFALDKGIPMVLSAYMTRFMIRRIPLVG